MTRLLQLSGNGNTPLLFQFFVLVVVFWGCFFFLRTHRKMNIFFSITVQRDTQWVGLTGSVLVAEELSVLRDTSPMMSVPCHVVGDQNCPQCLTL